MSDQQVLTSPEGMVADSTPVAFERWSEPRIRDALVSSEAEQRLAALSMVVSPDAPVDALVVEVVRCAGLSRNDPAALHIATTVLTLMKTAEARHVALEALALLAREEMPRPVRIMAANGFWLYQAVPTSAWPFVAQMVFSDDALLRQVALAAAVPHAAEGASHIAAAAARVGPLHWSTEGLNLLGASAGADPRKQQQVEHYVLQSLQGTTHPPTLIAGYSALARVNTSSTAVLALAQVAGQAISLDDAKLALQALSQLGETARSAIPALVAQLIATDDAVREEAICHALVALGIAADEVPLQRVLLRVSNGPDESVVAHCMLLGLHGKAFVRAAPLVAKRYSEASFELKRVLDAVHEMLTGQPLLVAPPPQSR